MSLQSDFARFYGNHQQVNTMSTTEMTEEQIKSAMLELFIKSASEANIDLEKLSQPQINAMYAEWESDFIKAAEEAEKEESVDDKKDKARAEHEEKKASISKLAESDALGRQMARSFLDELDKVAAEKQGGARLDGAKKAITEGVAKGKAKVTEFASKAKDKYVDTVKGKGVAEARSTTSSGQRILPGMEGEAKRTLRDHARVAGAQAARAGAIAAPAALIAGGGAAAHHGMKKKSSIGDFDLLAAELAVEKAAAAGFDPEECGEKIAAILTLGGLTESEKVASIQDTDDALHCRAAEFLESAGYPVNWGG